MVDPSAIQERMEVVTSCGIHVGVVDHVEGDSIKLTRNDPDAGGKHHYIPLDWVDTVGSTVRLTTSWEETRDRWLTAPVAPKS